ncbi:hypothetical protein FQA39_LY05673 [Lamprigera yunnana]|nr:hypothetical protein FQA39_LY05673 [Lamprigera yunnana]
MDDKSSNMYLKRTAVPSQKLPINAAVLSEMQPNIIGTPSTSTFGSDIRKHDDEVIHTDDLLKARQQLKRAECESDLNTDEEGSLKRKRKTETI